MQADELKEEGRGLRESLAEARRDALYKADQIATRDEIIVKVRIRGDGSTRLNAALPTHIQAPQPPFFTAQANEDILRLTNGSSALNEAAAAALRRRYEAELRALQVTPRTTQHIPHTPRHAPLTTHPTPRTTYHIPHATRHTPHVTCHMPTCPCTPTPPTPHTGPPTPTVRPLQAKLRGVHALAVAQRGSALTAQRARLAALRQQADAAEAEVRGLEGSDPALTALVAAGDLADLQVRPCVAPLLSNPY